MSGSGRRSGSGLATALTSGLGLLVAGLLLLLVGDAFFPNDAATRSLWTALVGIIVLLAGMLFLLLRSPETAPAPSPRVVSAPGRPTPTPATAAVTASPAVEPEPEPEIAAPSPTMPTRSVTTAEASVRRAAALAADVVPPAAASSRSSFPTSIPGAYLQALSATSSGANDPWRDVAPPIAAALPFSPGIRRASEASAPWDESSDASEREAPRLELELARLRARVRELEVPVRTVAPTMAIPRTTGIPTAAKEPPTPPMSASLGPKGCIGCGTGLSATGPSHLCWGCGRTLCATCYWRFGPGPGLHRCPDCLSRAPTGSESISGGRLTGASPDARPAPVASMPRTPRR